MKKDKELKKSYNKDDAFWLTLEKVEQIGRSFFLHTKDDVVLITGKKEDDEVFSFYAKIKNASGSSENSVRCFLGFFKALPLFSDVVNKVISKYNSSFGRIYKIKINTNVAG